MQSSNDIMLQMILAQITDLQRRVTNQEDTINALKMEVARLQQQRPAVPFTPPLPLTAPPSLSQSLPAVAPQQAVQKRIRPKMASSATTADQESQKEQKTAFPLSTILHENEEVTVNIGTIWDAKAKTHVQFTTLTTVFDGKELVVTAAQDKAAESLVGMRSEKPGNILYKFRDALLAGGVIKKEFTIAPWKLCTVSRGGKQYNLEEIRETPICG